jgi:hypothetical protein
MKKGKGKAYFYCLFSISNPVSNSSLSDSMIPSNLLRVSPSAAVYLTEGGLRRD